MTLRKAQNNTVNTYINTKKHFTHSHLLYDYTQTPAHSPPHKHIHAHTHSHTHTHTHTHTHPHCDTYHTNTQHTHTHAMKYSIIMSPPHEGGPTGTFSVESGNISIIYLYIM